jgi:hypothetical protein
MLFSLEILSTAFTKNGPLQIIIKAIIKKSRGRRDQCPEERAAKSIKFLLKPFSCFYFEEECQLWEGIL